MSKTYNWFSKATTDCTPTNLLATTGCPISQEFQFLPMLEFSTAYEIFKASNNFPKGLITRYYMYDCKKEMGISQLLNGFIFRDFKILLSN